MALTKFRDVEAMKRAGTWRRAGDPDLWRVMRQLQELGARTAHERRFPAGVHKHRSIDEMNLLHAEWRDAASRSRVAFRRAAPDDRGAIEALVLRALEDVGYAKLSPLLADEMAGQPERVASGDWARAVVAVVGGRVVGVALTSDDVVDDLWVDAAQRGRGVGRALLALAVDEIARRGCRRARLRVAAANDAAVRFYQKNGWRTDARAPHQRYGFEMVSMSRDATR